MSDTELLHKSKPETVRRVEVFTGAGRRRAWTAEQKAQIIAESCEGSETVSAVARRHGLTPQQLFGRRRQARQADSESGERDGMEMHQIRYFLALCEERSFTRAGRQCGISQPSLTNATVHPTRFSPKSGWTRT
jgi:transposase-like protein